MEIEDPKPLPAGPLAGLLDLNDYQQRVSNIYPSRTSLDWYIRQHRARLIESGALLHIARKSWVVPEKFDACILSAAVRQRHQQAPT